MRNANYGVVLGLSEKLTVARQATGWELKGGCVSIEIASNPDPGIL